VKIATNVAKFLLESGLGVEKNILFRGTIFVHLWLKSQPHIMNVLVLGSGGREHAISWKLSQSSQLNKLYVAPGNAGTGEIADNVDLDMMDFDAVKKFVLENGIDIVVVGPEAPLVEGIQDYFLADSELSKTTLIGPDKKAAKLEGSKEFAKRFMDRHNIPTAKYQSFSKSTLSKGYTFLEKLKSPYVLKCDGLAAGKGVLIIDDLEEAKAKLKSILQGNAFGKAGNKVVIEEFLKGIEVSMFVITDGESYKILPEAKDYKRIGEGDTGLNTGGMGAVSPVSFVNPEFMEKVKNQVIIPTIKGIKKDNLNYNGFIFFGLIKVSGDPYVIEYNCRLGDPEAEVIIPRIKSDLLHFFEGIASGTLSECDVEIDERSAATVMMVSGGYPEKYENGKEITGLGAIKDSVIFHSGTKEKDGKVISAGGRVLAVTTLASDMETALAKSYANADSINFESKYFRKDIGADVAKPKPKQKS
jgi:phosphoribosylamine--glycine ligase